MDHIDHGQVYIHATTGQRWRVTEIDRNRVRLVTPDGRTEWVHGRHLHPTEHDTNGLPRRTGYTLRTWAEPDFDRHWAGVLCAALNPTDAALPECELRCGHQMPHVGDGDKWEDQ